MEDRPARAVNPNLVSPCQLIRPRKICIDFKLTAFCVKQLVTFLNNGCQPTTHHFESERKRLH